MALLVGPAALPVVFESLPVGPSALLVGPADLPVCFEPLPIGPAALPVCPAALPVGPAALPVGPVALPVCFEYIPIGPVALVRSDMRLASTIRVKGKVYKVAVRPAMLYGMETVALTKRQEAEMEVIELTMLRFPLGVARMDKIRNEYIRGTAQVGRFEEKTREARLVWFGHVGLRRKDDGYRPYVGRRMLRMELPGKRKRGMPKRRFMDLVKADM